MGYNLWPSGGLLWVSFVFFLKLIDLLLAAFGSSLLRAGFLYLRREGATLQCGAQASHGSGFSCCRAQPVGVQASVVAACVLQ